MSSFRDEVESIVSVNSEFEDFISSVASSPPRLESRELENEFKRSNIIHNLWKRQMGFGYLKQIPLRTFFMKDMFPVKTCCSHVFMGMTRCGRFLLTYTMTTDQDDENWFASIYKYMLHFWAFKPAGQALKIAEVTLFGTYKIMAPLHLYICEWPNDTEKILIYGLIKENFNVEGGALSSHQHAYVTITALPSVDNCQECRTVAASYLLDDIASSWDSCLRLNCLKHGYTVHTHFDIIVPYPEFNPKICLKYKNYAVFNTNNFIYALRISLENCDTKNRDDFQSDSVVKEVSSPLSTSLIETEEIPEETHKPLNLKEQIIQDFSEEINLTSFLQKTEKESDVNINICNEEMSATPLRIDLESEKAVIGDTEVPGKEEDKSGCFLSPNDVKMVSRTSRERKIDRSDERPSSSQRKFKSFFSKHQFQRNSFPRKKLPLNCRALCKSHDTSISLLNKFISRRLHETNSKTDDATYEFVDDAHSEVEKISLFRLKRLAEKKYEFQELDSENIVPFSTVRMENTLRSPRKLVQDTPASENPDLRCVSPRYQDLTISVPSPKSPLYLDILSSPNQYVESVLRPLNRNTPGNNPLSPLTRYLSPPLCHKLRSPNSFKQKACDVADDVRKKLDTRLILEHGIIIHDISERVADDECLCSDDIYTNLFKNASKLEGISVRLERRFVEVDDELVSVLTDIEDDDMSGVTGYHTALNVEAHGTGYTQLEMISKIKAEKIMAPCLLVDQQTLDIEGICHSVATTLCNVSNKTFTFCNDYDIEILDVCPRSSQALILLMMRIEGCEGVRDESSKMEHYEASVTFVWSLTSGQYRISTVVPPKRVDWVWDDKHCWNPAKVASKNFRLLLPADLTLCEPPVRVMSNASFVRGISLSCIEDIENGVRFLL